MLVGTTKVNSEEACDLKYSGKRNWNFKLDRFLNRICFSNAEVPLQCQYWMWAPKSLIAGIAYFMLSQEWWEQYGQTGAKSAAIHLGKMPCPRVALCSCHVILIDSLGNLSLSLWGPSSALELWVSNWWQRLTGCVCVCGSVERRRLYRGQQLLLLRPSGNHTSVISFYL